MKKAIFTTFSFVLTFLLIQSNSFSQTNNLVYCDSYANSIGYEEVTEISIGAGDSNTFNDETCESLFATSQFVAAMLSIIVPEEGCDLFMEDVTVTVANLGDTIVPGNLDLSYMHAAIAIVTETYPDTVFPYDTLTYTFNTQIDFSVTTSMDFEILAWLDLVGDPIQTNDTISIIVWSGLTPADPIVNDITVWSGEFGTFVVSNLDTSLTYTWYDADTNFVGPEFTYTTPNLFDTTIYFVEASSGEAPAISITEIGLGLHDYVEVTNLSSFSINVSSYTVAASNSYTDINSVNTIFWDLGVFTGNEVQYKSDNSIEGLNYWGDNLLWHIDYAGWVMIIDDTGEIVDMVIWGWTAAEMAAANIVINGFTIDMTTGWVDDGITNYSLEFYNRITFDNDIATDWENIAIGDIGTFNPALVGTQTGGVCGSNLIPVTANVQFASFDAGVLSVIAPVPGAYYTFEDVSAEVYNNGSTSISNFPISYTINGGYPMQEVCTGILNPGDTLVFTFTQQANLSNYGNYDICVFTQLLNDNHSYNDAACTTIYHYQGPCSYALPYGNINDPAVYSATVFAYDEDWWAFELPYDCYDVSVSLCYSGFDTKLAVYSNCAGNYLAYNDDYCGVQSQVDFSYLSAGTYFAKVYGYLAFYGNYVLSITDISSSISPQTINLPASWSMFSTYLQPTAPNISDVLSPVLSNLEIVKDWNGQIYWPQFGVNQIGNLTLGEGYQINMDQADIVMVSGYYTPPEETTIAIPAAWSILGYLRLSPANISPILSSIVNDIIIVKDGQGDVFWPQWGVNLIGNMIPGEGYQIKMNSPQSFVYPAN